MKKLIYITAAVLFLSCNTFVEEKNENENKVSERIPLQDTVKGVWIAMPNHNTLMQNHNNIKKGVAELKALGINTLFVCTWADNKTAYNSKLLLENSNYQVIEETNFFTKYKYTSETNDPVKDLIAEAHKHNMRVIFWFEYGFMAAWGKEPTPENNPILAKHPDWAGIGNDGRVCNYNNTDFYFNSYNPEVQDFILGLIEESLELYPEVDGIQGDDRLPACPSNSGYDEYTLTKYKAEHDGNEPPQDFTDEDWVNRRIKILNNVGVKLYKMVKEKGEHYTVSFSPNPFPWCKEKLMQDWPGWIDSGIVELLNVQIYRTSFEAYKTTVDEANKYVKEKTDKNIFAPGLLLGTGAGKGMSEELLDSVLNYNKELGLKGHSYFYVKWLLEHDDFKEVVKQ